MPHSLPATFSFRSVGLAALAIIHKDTHMMVLARRQYSSALTLLARAIEESKESVNGALIAASFNLFVFELVTLLQPPTCGMVNEVEGLLHIGYTAALAYLISEQKVPTFVLGLMQSCKAFAVGTLLLPIIELFDILSSLIGLYIRMKHSDGQDYVQFIATAIHLDQSLLAWVNDLSLAFTFDATVGGSSHPYEHGWPAKAWNYYWFCRALASRIVIDSLDVVFPSIQSTHVTLIAESKAQYSKSLSILRQAPREISASISLILGRTGRSSLALSSDTFFLIIILQSLAILTDPTCISQ
ncbi:hypothetical protein BDV24DRAFT_163987 [Aspergillus arachidicola]|uniref:Uncharacterized protein n=1 Tax=Aspergillus arachidicola TaxID=656916 RepID=A0A2G7FVS5_9EURO|nr:hypothetical protein BDV24DRAFT_163987 [Aspergillus arachidicola]PIG83961.1 hypothetical protein AARAC_008641 [Aspergillus arachidicola]